MTININDLTYGQIKEISNLVKGGESTKTNPFKTGENYLIRTVTMILVGRLDEVHETELVLSSASWIADTGRFHDALQKGTLDEVEPFKDDVIVGRGALIDATIWDHALPKEQK